MQTLYEIIIGNKYDSVNYSKLFLSNEPLTECNINIKSIVPLDRDEFIVRIQKPIITINAWDASEFQELDRVREQLV